MNYKLSKNNLLFYLLLFLMASYLLSSCRNNKVANCREIMNFSARLDREIKENLQTQNIENVINVAKRFENTAQEIKEIKITDEQLKIYSQELADVYQNYARSTHNFIQAFREKDREQAIFYKNQVNKLFEQQQQLVSSINSYCQP